MQNTVLLRKNRRPMFGEWKKVSAGELDEYCFDCTEELALMMLDEQ